MSEALFDRLGGDNGIRKIVDVLVDNHASNPVVSARFAGSDLGNLKKMAGDFFVTGSGGPEIYTGKDMISAHLHMNISGDEFVAVLDDAMNALGMLLFLSLGRCAAGSESFDRISHKWRASGIASLSCIATCRLG